MARPPKQGLSYFPHDTDACNDEKVQSLMALYGAEGYAFYFILLEKVFRTENGRITCGSEAIKAGLARSIGIALKRFEVMLATALEVGCFNADLYKKEGILTSAGIEKRVSIVNSLRERDRERKDKYKDKDKRKRKGERGKPMGKPTENSENPEIKVFIDFAYEQFKVKTGEPLHIIGGKDGKTVKSLLGTYDLEKLKRLWDTFLQSKDPFILQAGFSLGVFQSQINKLLTQPQGGTPTPQRGSSKTAGNWIRLAERERARQEALKNEPKKLTEGGNEGH